MGQEGIEEEVCTGRDQGRISQVNTWDLPSKVSMEGPVTYEQMSAQGAVGGQTIPWPHVSQR